MEPLSFLLGLIAGASIVIGYGMFEMNKLTKGKVELLKKLRDKMNDVNTSPQAELDKANSIKDRLIQASRIADTQNELRAQAEMPSKNALHSRHKNGIVAHVQELEAQKISILRTVLAEGFDPIITVLRDGGTREDIPLSVYVLQAEQQLSLHYTPAPGTTPEATPSSGGPRKAGKFVIYTGGKDDGGTTH